MTQRKHKLFPESIGKVNKFTPVNTFPERLRYLMVCKEGEWRGKQAAFAKRLGVTPSYLSKLLSPKAEIPIENSNIWGMVRAMGEDENWLRTGRGREPVAQESSETKEVLKVSEDEMPYRSGEGLQELLKIVTEGRKVEDLAHVAAMVISSEVPDPLKSEAARILSALYRERVSFGSVAAEAIASTEAALAEAQRDPDWQRNVPTGQPSGDKSSPAGGGAVEKGARQSAPGKVPK